MGDVYITITVINDSDPDKQREVQFLADPGATRAWIPEEIAQELDIQPVGSVPLELADGSSSFKEKTSVSDSSDAAAQSPVQVIVSYQYNP